MATTRYESNKRMSQCVAHGDLVFTSGQVADNADSEGVAGQTRDVLHKIDLLLKQAGTDKSKLLSATVYLADMRSYDAMNGAWDAWVDPGNTPARATVEARLAAPKYQVEIAVIAAR